MKKSVEQLEQLARLAQIRSDAELKRFSTFRAYIDSVATQVQNAQNCLSLIYEQDEAFSIAEARLANQEAGRLAHGIVQMHSELDRLRPSFDVARLRAVKEFGRVQVLKKITHDLRKCDRRFD